MLCVIQSPVDLSAVAFFNLSLPACLFTRLAQKNALDLQFFSFDVFSSSLLGIFSPMEMFFSLCVCFFSLTKVQFVKLVQGSVLQLVVFFPRSKFHLKHNFRHFSCYWDITTIVCISLVLSLFSVFTLSNHINLIFVLCTIYFQSISG